MGPGEPTGWILALLRFYTGKPADRDRQGRPVRGQTIVFRYLKHRSWHEAAIGLLVVMQLQLLVILVLHHHVLPRIALDLSTAPTSIAPPGRHSRPTSREQGYCPACQILRHSAVRPALGNPTPYRSSVAPLLASCTANVVFPVRPSGRYGRAPPLA